MQTRPTLYPKFYNLAGTAQAKTRLASVELARFNMVKWRSAGLRCVMRSLKAITLTSIVTLGLFSSPAILTPADASIAATTTAISGSPFTTIDAGGSIDFTATLTNDNTFSAVPGEIIDFRNLTTGVDLGMGTTNASGAASLLGVIFPTPGMFNIQANFNGDLTNGLLGSNDLVEVNILTPLPATLPLFATGIGGLGLLGWRRRRKAQAI
jgi:hypothetical protein